MKNDDFKKLDQIHVPPEVKAKLLTRSAEAWEQREKKARKKSMAWKGLIAAAAAVLLVFGITAQKENNLIDYAGYLSVSAEMIDQPLQQLKVQDQQLDAQWQAGALSNEEYLNKKEELQQQWEALNEKRRELQNTYKIDEAALNTARFSTDPAENQRIAQTLQQKLEWERQEEEIQKQQRQVLDAYRAGSITADQLLEKMTWLDAQEEVLDAQEDAAEGESLDLEDQNELELAQKLLNGQISASEYRIQKQQLDEAEDQRENDWDDDVTDRDDDDDDHFDDDRFDDDHDRDDEDRDEPDWDDDDEDD